MKNLIYNCWIIALFLLSGCHAPDNTPHNFSIGDRAFLLDGKPFVVKAAEMHYTRVPAEYWEHRIRMCKALGMNTICTYVFWNIHEQKPGEFNFEGQNDVAAFCRLAQKHGMYVMLRPGPYVCSEWEMGGLPWWLLKKKDIRLRSNDPYFLERAKLFLTEVGKQLAGLQVTRGGNIIMVQVENEYGAYAVDKKYMANIRDLLKEVGFTDVPLFQCDWSSTFRLNGLDDLLWTLNFGPGLSMDEQFKTLKEVRPHTPLMCSEYWVGWFDHWGGRHETRDARVMLDGLKEMMEKNISFSMYLVHGGTTFGQWTGANSPAYAPTCSSYDWDAPVSEAGRTTPKFYGLRDLMAQYADSGQVLPPVPEPYPVIGIPEFRVDEVAPLFDNLPSCKLSEEIKPMEQFDQGWGTILYRTELPDVKAGSILLVKEVHDWAQVYADGKLLGRLDRRRDENTLVLPALPQGTRLDILVEATGRVNFDMAIHDRKGITEKVELMTDTVKASLKNWKVYSFPVDYPFIQDKKYVRGDKYDGPAYYRAIFNLKETGDVFLDMRNWGKGMVWVNGKSLGRFWRIGPQQTLFMPGCWLKKGKNEIVILDLLGPERAAISGLEKPIADLSRPEMPLTHRKKGETLDLRNERAVAKGRLEPGNGWQEVKFGKTVRGRYFCIEALNAQDGKDDAAIAELYLLNPEGEKLSRQYWSIVYADSENTAWGNFTADKIYDLQESTCWNTRKGDKYPHQVVIDLKEEQDISGFRYLPRSENGFPGMIKEYRVYVKESPFDVGRSLK